MDGQAQDVSRCLPSNKLKSSLSALNVTYWRTSSQTFCSPIMMGWLAELEKFAQGY